MTIKYYASCYYRELPPKEYEINTLDDLERFKQVVLESEEHYVHKIETPDNTFECVPITYHNPFLNYIETQIKVKKYIETQIKVKGNLQCK